VTLGDLEARRRGTQKTVLERKHEPTFEAVVEIRERNNVAVHRDVGTVVDLMLRGYPPAREARWMDADGSVHTAMEEPTEAAPEIAPPAFDLREMQRGYGPRRREQGERDRHRPAAHSAAAPNGFAAPEAAVPAGPPVTIYPFGIPRATLQEAIEQLGISAKTTDSADDADFFMTTKSHYNRRPTEVREAERQGVPVYVLRRGTVEQLADFLRRFGPPGPGGAAPDQDRPGALPMGDDGSGEETGDPAVQSALEEAKEAVERVLGGERKVSLSPQSSFIRRLQHGLAARYNLGSASTGREPGRRVIIRRRR
jgi:hypothetical protein